MILHAAPPNDEELDVEIEDDKDDKKDDDGGGRHPEPTS